MTRSSLWGLFALLVFGIYASPSRQLPRVAELAGIGRSTVPHLMRIAREAAPQRQALPLGIVGAIVAGRATYPSTAAPLREEWRDEYLTATQEALRLSAESLQHSGLPLPESQELIATVAALHGHTDLAMHLFLQGDVTELSCPVCGEVIQFRNEAETIAPHETTEEL